ncbi:MAG: NAD(P)-binding domain-containing protein, partial [Planctomycetota bacterium]
MTDEPTIGFLGCGRMATALAGGLIAKRFAPRERVIGSDPSPGSRDAFAAATDGSETLDAADTGNRQLAARADVLVLAVKPYQVRGALEETAADRKPDALVISVAAGVTLESLAAAAGADCRLIRV